MFVFQEMSISVPAETLASIAAILWSCRTERFLLHLVSVVVTWRQTDKH
jgi:hypothetical protein